MNQRKEFPWSAISSLTSASAHVEIHSTSRPDWSDKNGLATGRKNRREAVFAFLAC